MHTEIRRPSATVFLLDVDTIIGFQQCSAEQQTPNVGFQSTVENLLVWYSLFFSHVPAKIRVLAFESGV